MKRPNFDPHESVSVSIAKMSEGNPGAITVLMRLLTTGDIISILNLDDMNIWGPQIWVGFKDYCGGDLEKFKKALEQRDPEMVKVINLEVPDQIAVTSGASYNRPS